MLSDPFALNLTAKLWENVALCLKPIDRFSLLKVCHATEQPARLALFGGPEVTSYACALPGAMAMNPQNPPHGQGATCFRPMYQLLRDMFRKPIKPKCWTIIRDLTKQDEVQHGHGQHPLNIRLHLVNDQQIHATIRRLRDEVLQLCPVRDPHNDWLDDLENSQDDSFIAAALVFSVLLQELYLQTSYPSDDSLIPLGLVIGDIEDNQATLQGKELAPLRRLRTLVVDWQVDNVGVDLVLYRNADLSSIPSLRKVCYGYGWPLFSTTHQNLRVLGINLWGCRKHIIPFQHQMPPNHAHLIAHDAALNTLRNLPNLEKLKLTDIRICNELLGAHHYEELQPNGGFAQRVQYGLPTVMLQTHASSLKDFMMHSVVNPVGQNNGHWLYRGYVDAFPSWDPYSRLENLSIDCWFFFLGNQPPNPVGSLRPPVTASQLPASIKRVRITNLADGYIDQFRQFLTVLHQEMANGGLRMLKYIEYSMLNDNTDFADQAIVTQMKTDLGLVGVVLKKEGYQ